MSGTGSCLVLVAASYAAFVSVPLQFTCLVQGALGQQQVPSTLRVLQDSEEAKF